MSTFLELVAELHSEVGAAGAPPTTVLNQRGEAKRLVNWVKKANRLIQLQWENWKFLRVALDQALTPEIATLNKPANLKMWDYDTFFLTEVGSTEKFQLDVVEYEDVKQEILDTRPGLPSRVIVMPDNSLVFEQPPDAAHQLTCDYYKNPVDLEANSDVSVIPAGFHDAILGRAEMLYAFHEGAPEIQEQGETLFADTLSHLEASQLPNKRNSRYRTGGHFTVETQ